MFSFFLTTFFSRERTAGVVAFLVILVFWIVGNTLFREFLTNPYTPDESYIPLMFFPPWVMARWVTWLGHSMTLSTRWYGR